MGALYRSVCFQLSFFSILVGGEVTIAQISLLSTVNFFIFWWLGVSPLHRSYKSAAAAVFSCSSLFYAHVDGPGFQPHVWPPSPVLAWAAAAHGRLWRASPQRAVRSSLGTDPRPALSAGRCPHLLQNWPGKTFWGGVRRGGGCQWVCISVDGMLVCIFVQNWPGKTLGWGGGCQWVCISVDGMLVQRREGKAWMCSLVMPQWTHFFSLTLSLLNSLCISSGCPFWLIVLCTHRKRQNYLRCGWVCWCL